MDQGRLEQARELAAQAGKGGIGTLSEKNLHAVLKYYIEPYAGSHEVKIGRYVADIVGEQGIVEIQTRGFDRLRDKLETFLSVGDVTVVYPIPHTKWLRWADPDTGEVGPRRKSPKRGVPCHAFYELYKIRPLLTRPGLHLRLLLLEVEEIRYLNGWSRNRKRGSSRAERFPLAVVDEVYIHDAGEYWKLIPPGLPSPFTSLDFARAAGLHRADSQTALHVLHTVGAVRRVGKQGNAYLYETVEPDPLADGESSPASTGMQLRGEPEP